MKQWISLFLAILLLCCSLPVGAETELVSGETEDGWRYMPNEIGDAVYDGYAITGYVGDQLNVTVPAAINGQPVVKIGEWALGAASIETVVIPEGITELENGAFFSNYYLKKITLPSTLTVIGERCFEGCNYLTEINLPEGITSLGWNTFRLCSDLTDITLPSTLRTIGEGCFEYCSDLATVNLPEGLEEIGPVAFSRCSVLSSVTFPQSLKTIGQNAFSLCHTLPRVTIPAGVTNIGPGAFGQCDGIEAFEVAEDNQNYQAMNGCLYSKDGTVLMQVPFNDYYLGAIVVPNGVTTISSSAFYGSQVTQAVNLPASVTDIEPGAMAFCRNLKHIRVDEANPAYCTVDKVLFTKDMKKLVQYPVGYEDVEQYTVPSTVTEIGDEAFRMADSLMHISLPTGLKRIGAYAFASCRFPSLHLPDGLEEIGEYAFYYNNQTMSFSLPDSVTYIGRKAFHSTGYYFEQSNWQDGLLYIGNHLIHCDIYYDKPAVIPDTTVSIAEEAFYDCYNLPSVVIPEGIKQLHADTFNDCPALQSVTLPGSLETIGDRAFAYCTGLTKISLASVKELGSEVFYNCDHLTTVNLGDSLTAVGDETFAECYQLRRVTFPAATETIGENLFQYSSPDIILLGYQDTAIHRYANEHNIAFVALDSFTYGDLSGDKTTSAEDALTVLKSAVGKYTLDNPGIIAGDVDGNFKVDANDALIMLKLIVGKIKIFPVQQ